MRANRVFALAAATMLVVAVASAAVVRARQAPGGTIGGHRGFGMGPLMALNYISQQLNLTDQQKQQVKDIVRSRRDDIKALVDQWFSARRTLRRAIDGGNDQDVASAVSQVASVEVKAAQLHAALRARIFTEVLQPDQRARAAELETRFGQKADQWRQRIDAFLDAL